MADVDLDLLDDDLDIELLENAVDRPVALPMAVSGQRSQPIPHRLDEPLLASYVYPTNLPIRDYQYSIVNRALFHNVLVALPTGLGKTFIASTVMLNYLRWFPDLKIIFMAPTKPLVAQQIKACCGITGIPSSKVAILLDRTRKNRRQIWDDKTVFFTTPQVVENDLTSGIVDPKLIVLLVVDEAHRAKGNYAYNNVVKFISRFTSAFRILALTATPASDVDGVQEIVDNLHISYVEVRTERSIDIFRYLKRKKVERITAGVNDDVQRILDFIVEAATPLLRQANEKGVYDVMDPYKINAFTALDAQRKLRGIKNMPEGLLWANYFLLQVLVVVGQCFRRLHVYGVRTFYSYFKEKYTEFTTKYNSGKSKNGTAAKFYLHPSIKRVVSICDSLVAEPAFLGSLKLEITISEVSLFFENTVNDNSRVIIFTELRQSALDIVDAIERSDPEKKRLRPHIFIGQAKEKEKFDEEKFLSKGKKKTAKAKQDSKKKDKKSAEPKSNQTSSELAQQSGMNQKKQKEVISEFKNGNINILVATSIGEEGLDIGEVDLIICYDSTSSPIKNIQRMGRTGRNRDGKVILLFSSNEESKFDKAMAGYEYIQQHIMKGLVQMNEQNRLIPSQFNPVVNEREIEIPKENLEIKDEDDEDEIIRLATKYMTQTQSTKKETVKATKGKKRTKSDKIEKRFFMPDDVETGFQLAGVVLRKEDAAEAKRRRIEEQGLDFLDSLLDSDDEAPALKPVDTTTLLARTVCTELSPVPQCATSANVTTSHLPSDLHVLSSKSPLPPALSSSSGKVKKLLGPAKPRIKQPEIFNWRSNKGVLELSKSQKSIEDISEKLEALDPSGTPSDTPINANAKASTDLDEEFSDDDDILMLARRTQIFKEKEKIDNENLKAVFPQSNTPKPIPPATETSPERFSPVVDSEPVFFSADSGILTEQQKQELYLHYYTDADQIPSKNFYDTLDVSHNTHAVGHSSRTLRYITLQQFLKKLSNVEAEDLLEEFDTAATNPPKLFPDIIQLPHE